MNWSKLKEKIRAALKDDEPSEEEIQRRDRFSPPEPYFYRMTRSIIGIATLTALLSIVYPDMLTKPLITIPESGVFTLSSLISPFILFFMMLYFCEQLGGYVLGKAAWVVDVLDNKINPSEAVKTIVLVLLFVVAVWYFKIFPLHSTIR